MKPSYNELRVLSGLWLGNVESKSFFPGVKAQTFTEMVAKKWVEAVAANENIASTYRASDLGLTMHRRYAQLSADQRRQNNPRE